MIVKIDANSLLKRIDKMGSETNIGAAIGKACALVEGEAKKKAPKDTIVNNDTTFILTHRQTFTK